MRQGVRWAAAARLRRRAGVSATSGTAPTTSARLADFKPSSIAHSASLARCVSTSRQEDGSSPRAARPCPHANPSSRASAEGQHHKMCTRAPEACPASPCKRRTASRNAKPNAAAQSPAAAAQARPSLFTSCKAAASRPPVRRRSISGAPSVHEGAGAHAASVVGAERSRATGSKEAGAPERPSSAAMRARKSSSSAERCPSGTARRVSPFRFGQEGQSPTPLKRTRERRLECTRKLTLGLGPGREIPCGQADGEVGDGAAWSTGERSRNLGRQRRRGERRVLFLFYITPRRGSRSKNEQLEIKCSGCAGADTGPNCLRGQHRHTSPQLTPALAPLGRTSRNTGKNTCES